MLSMKKLLSALMISILMISLVGCGSTKSSGVAIIEAKEAIQLLNKENVVVVAVQQPEKVPYENEHVKGSVKIDLNDLVINVPVKNMLPPKTQVEEVLSKKGISNDSTVLIYDTNNNMDAARIWWTLKVYGHENIKVISGGFDALKAAGAELTAEVPVVTPAKYTAKEKNNDMIATIDEVKKQVNTPDKNVVLIDTRTDEEFNEGTIPGSLHINYLENDYKDTTYKSVETIKLDYIEKGVTPEKTIILYCKTSVRGAQTFAALHNAGYKNIKLYDGAWLEWTADKSAPIQTKENGAEGTNGTEGTTPVESNNQDNS
jgi:thiosulfate/3-mercaptopyruvate sulfurtransferase